MTLLHIPHNSVESTFLCLLPSKDDTIRLHEKFDALFSIHVFPYIKLPLHVTLYFFGESTLQKNADVMNWMHHVAQEKKGPIVVNTQSVQSFQKDGRDFVYYLPLSSERILYLHDDLYEKFEDIHVDLFDFIPHLSLFYPDRNLTEEEIDAVQKIYKCIENMTFDRLAFAAEKKNGTHFLNIQTL